MENSSEMGAPPPNPGDLPLSRQDILPLTRFRKGARPCAGAPAHLGLRVGARVAFLRCPILRPAHIPYRTKLMTYEYSIERCTQWYRSRRSVLAPLIPAPQRLVSTHWFYVKISCAARHLRDNRSTMTRRATLAALAALASPLARAAAKL